ncbi:helix-turn-helix domain-containing protein [Rhodococcus cerastii]|nr:helix-turn-helix domain-containing protein [Rhodococcus cerastii]
MSPRELERRARHTLAVLRHVEEVSGSVAATCRYYGISRQCYYVWRRRFDEEGIEGLNDRSSVPHHQPTTTDPEGNREDPLASPAVSFRAAEDLDVSRPVPRRDHQPIGCLAHPSQARPQPAAGIAPLQTHADPVEALRETTPRPPTAGGREMH